MKNIAISFILILTFFSNYIKATTKTKIGIKTSVALIIPNEGDNYYGYPNGLHDIGGKTVALTFEKARTSYQFDISDIPENSIITSASLSVSFSNYYNRNYECKVTFADDKSSPQDQYWEISSANVLLSLDNYDSGNYNLSALKNDLISCLGNNYYYLGAYTPDEIYGNSNANLELSLNITYTPKVEIIAQNNFPGGTIKVDGTVRSSPYPFIKNVGNTASLEAIDQNNSGYYRLWNDTEAPLNKSKWVKRSGSSSWNKNYNKSYSFTVAENDDGSEYEAGLRKRFNVTFKNQYSGGITGGQIIVNGNTYNAPTSTFNVIEQNTITATAINSTVNEIGYYFQKWSDNSTEKTDHEFTINSHQEIKAHFKGIPKFPESIRNLRFNSYHPRFQRNVKLYWDEHPNPLVTHYKIWRQIRPRSGGFSPKELIGTVNRGTTSFTDYDYFLTNGYTDYRLYYDVKAYYQLDNTVSSDNYEITYGENSAINKKAKLDDETPLENVYENSISNYPNPYNPSTTISFSIKEMGNTKITVYDALGRKITELVNEVKQPGSYNVTFDGSNLPSGIYFYTMKVNSFVQTKKMLLTK